jgi:hypothetical protein
LPYIITDHDAKVLKQLVRWFQGDIVSTRMRANEGSIDHQEHQAPEMYVGRTTDQGIPGLTGDIGIGTGKGEYTGTSQDPSKAYAYPGEGQCTVYQLLNLNGKKTLVKVAMDPLTVYNLCKQPIPGDVFVELVRDKYGAWYAISCEHGGAPVPTGTGSTGTATGSGSKGTGTGTGHLGCCPGHHYDLTLLFATVTNVTGDCVFCIVSNTFTTGPGNGVYYVQYACIGGALLFGFDTVTCLPSVLCNGVPVTLNFSGATGGLVSCSPLLIQWHNISFMSPCGNCSFDITISQ